jgi:hypothetical protein
MIEPTAEGLLRYPQTGGTYAGNPAVPCTCVPTCERRCDGVCGCEACDLAFTVFCDESGFTGPEGLTIPANDALSMYRSL